eukprot:CAMPEP_0117773088 /NCGR_PEP_ID=MMETSP0947-20121206/25594_1 /TAXON_ID=44440 /ORGANISM="Chattonella subsalsa, Strain CCMP2191" /LENGTH=46 /DNA_ID= /DNA_START= /DNA_END= /DNA_ORIENTATION=
MVSCDFPSIRAVSRLSHSGLGASNPSSMGSRSPNSKASRYSAITDS